MDDLAGLFDGAWLMVVKPLLVAHLGAAQAGGRFDMVLMVLGLVIALQIRRNLGLPSFLEKVDLHQGFDLSWRDGVRLQLGRAGLVGRMWLVADAALGFDMFRVRLGPLVGSLMQLRDVGIGQGRRGAVHQFGALVRALTDAVEASTLGAGLSPPLQAVQACRGLPHAGPRLACDDPSQVWPLVASAVGAGGTCALREWYPALAQLPSYDLRLLFLDAVSLVALLIIQFVDDTFIVQSTVFGLRCANRGLSVFCKLWRHRIKGGSKRPVVLPIGASGIQASDVGPVGDVEVAVEGEVQVGGIFLDGELTFEKQLKRSCSRVVKQSECLMSALDDAGFGLPFVSDLFWARVEPSALYGAEVLASFGGGWRTAARRLNDAHYRAAKSLLGLRGVSLGDGGHVRALHESRFLTRLGSRVAQRIIMARARLLCLPDDSPISGVLKAAVAQTGVTWLDHARVVTLELGVVPDFSEFVTSFVGGHSDPEAMRIAARSWKSRVVVPAIRRQEALWFAKSIAELNEAGLIPYAELVPFSRPIASELRWASWGKTMWRFYRAWCVARASQGFPWAVWGVHMQTVPMVIEICPLCGVFQADLCHILEVCSGTVILRNQLGQYPAHSFYKWVLTDEACLDVVKMKVRYVGLCLVAAFSELRRKDMF
jgi:hypothetical protein